MDLGTIFVLVSAACGLIVWLKLREHKAEKVIKAMEANLDRMRERVLSNGDRAFISFAEDEYYDAVDLMYKRRYGQIIRRWGYLL